MFFKRKVDPVEKGKVLEVLGKFRRDTDAVDDATDTMRVTAAEHPNGIQSGDFEEKRLATVELVKQLLDDTKDHSNWPVLEDDKGMALMLGLQMSLNETYAQQLDSLRLQREYVEGLKADRVTSRDSDTLESVHRRMAGSLIELGQAASRLAKRYKVKPGEYARATR